MLIVLDYGMGNTASILNMLKKIGSPACTTRDEAALEAAHGIILPGVGAFDHGMQQLRSSGVLEVIERKVNIDHIPCLGICLGMQLLFESSEEGKESGLGWLAGTVKRFKDLPSEDNKKLKVPHIGWNTAIPKKENSLFNALEQDNRFYFVHSYHVECQDMSNQIATTNYGYEFASAVQKNNIFGVQFHPEKSHRFGMTLLKNFTDQIVC